MFRIFRMWIYLPQFSQNKDWTRLIFYLNYIWFISMPFPAYFCRYQLWITYPELSRSDHVSPARRHQPWVSMNSASSPKELYYWFSLRYSGIWSITVRSHDALIDPKIYYMKDKYVFHEQSLSGSFVREIERKNGWTRTSWYVAVIGRMLERPQVKLS